MNSFDYFISCFFSYTKKINHCEKISMGSVPASSEVCLMNSSLLLAPHSGKLSMKKEDSNVWVSVWVNSVESCSSLISFQGVWVCMLHRLNGLSMASSSTVCVSALDPSQGLEGLWGESAAGLRVIIASAVSVWVPRLFIRSCRIHK